MVGNPYLDRSASRLDRLSVAQAHIDDQVRRVASLVPGSRHHIMATNVLLLLQDSLFTLTLAKATLDAARSASGDCLSPKRP